MCLLWFSVHLLYRTPLGAGDLSQNPEGSGLGGPRAWMPILCVLHYAHSAGISMSGYMVEINFCVHNVLPGSPVEGHSAAECRISANVLLIADTPSHVFYQSNKDFKKHTTANYAKPISVGSQKRCCIMLHSTVFLVQFQQNTDMRDKV